MDGHRGDAIGIFDSGAGGLSVLAEALRKLPDERFVYYGDTLNAPYGTKTEEEVCTLAFRCADILRGEPVKALVIACNTATCAAAAALREMYPDWIIIGMEPALKLAHDRCPTGRIAVLATPVSLKSRKYRALYTQWGERAVSVPCPGLMDFVERGETDTPAVRDYLADKLIPFLRDDLPLAAVVLGCTHYSFLKGALRTLLPDSVQVLDGNEGTVRQLRRRLDAAGLLRRDPLPEGTRRFRILSSGGEDAVSRMQELLRLA